MSHVRQQVREAIVTALKTITALGNRVYPYRTIPHTILPDAIVYTIDDEVITDYDANGKEIRDLTIVIAVRAKVTDDLDDVIDGLCVSVEKAMRTDDTFGGLIKNLDLQNTAIDMKGGAEKSVGLATLEYSALYRINRSNPEVVIS